jgi:hypothetical protein
MRKIKCLLIVSCFTLCRLWAQEPFPVLPLPVHIETTDQQTRFFSVTPALSFKGLDASAKKRLQDHWDEFSNTKATAAAGKKIQVQVGLIGKDPQFDALIAKQIKQWGSKIGEEGYLMIFNDQEQVIAANTETGLFYALQTIKQLIRANWKGACMVADWPSFKHRSVYDDISRGPISTVAYIKEQIRRLAELKINELSFYIEHVVQPVSYPDFAPVNGKLTIPQIRELSVYAAKYHMRLVGSFQSFGHFEKILSLPKYRPMGETSTLIASTDPAAKKFLKSVIGELCDAFSGTYFNVDCDETFDLGKGKSKAYVDSIGAARFYANHINFLYDVVKAHGKKLMIAGDFVIDHEEVLDMLPKDVIYMTWEYGGQKNFAKWIEPFQKRGLDFMVCPGILNSYRLIPDMAMATANIDGFVEEGKQAGSSGVVTTVWDDGGAFLFSGDWYGVYKAADKSWNVLAKDKTVFDKRFSMTAYGSNDLSYVRAIDTMMTLRKLALTYNLNENVWHQKLLPDSGRQLILNNSDTDTALQIIHHAKKLLASAKPLIHGSDLKTMQISVDQYQLMMDSRLDLVQVAAIYRAVTELAKTDPANAIRKLNEAIIVINGLRKRYTQLEKRFRNAWLKENQPYSLDIAAAPYGEKLAQLTKLYGRLLLAAKQVEQHQALPKAADICLDIKANTHFYFQYWMLCGPFMPEANNGMPGFLYSGDAVTEKTPKPGDLISYKQKEFRWHKYASPTGGITELDDFYPAVNMGTAFAYCTITTDKAVTIASFAAANHGMEIYCNGAKVSEDGFQNNTIETEQKTMLKLKAGTNHILFKIPKGKASWSFSFRLDPKLNVTNQKYKYFLNTESGSHEAE